MFKPMSKKKNSIDDILPPPKPHVQIDEDVHTRIKIECARNRVRVKDWVRDACEAHLKSGNGRTA